jgi:hypothetical protein
MLAPCITLAPVDATAGAVAAGAVAVGAVVTFAADRPVGPEGGVSPPGADADTGSLYIPPLVVGVSATSEEEKKERHNIRITFVAFSVILTASKDRVFYSYKNSALILPMGPF